jgi:VanZ family protein
MKRLSPGRLLSLLLPPLAVMAVIFALSAQTDDTVDRAAWEILLRKLAHVTEYAMLTLAWWRALRGMRPRASSLEGLAGAAFLSLFYACSDEFHQTFVDGRHGTPVDVLIDAIGVALACWFASVQARRRRRTVGPSRPRAA